MPSWPKAPDGPTAARIAAAWSLDPTVCFLNHGSFGACPRIVLQHQRVLQDQIERGPVRFLHRELDPAQTRDVLGLAQLLFVRGGSVPARGRNPFRTGLPGAVRLYRVHPARPNERATPYPRRSGRHGRPLEQRFLEQPRLQPTPPLFFR